MDLERVLLVAAIVIGVVAMRLRGEPLRVRGLLLIPAVLTGAGLWDLYQHGPDASAGAVAFFIVTLATSAAFGAWRGTTIEISARGGFLYYRYRPMTIAVWAAAIAARGLWHLIEHAAATGSLGSQALLVTLGAGLLGEAAVVYPRAMRLGVPFAPDDRRGRAGLRP